MKNRNKLRRLKIGEKEYLWSYNYNDMDFKNYPYSYYLFVPKDNQDLKVRVHFTVFEPQMKLDIYKTEGTKCLFNGQRADINLCRPYFACRVLTYVFQNICKDTDKGEIDIEDGERILSEIGYFGK